MELLETLLHSFVNLAMLLFEYIGVGVITFAGIQGIVNYIRKSPNTRLILAKGLAMGLEFKLGSEILRTVIVRNLEEIYIVAGIIVLRAILTILIHWEIKNEENESNLHRVLDPVSGTAEKSAAATVNVDSSADSAAASETAAPSVESAAASETAAPSADSAMTTEETAEK